MISPRRAVSLRVCQRALREVSTVERTRQAIVASAEQLTARRPRSGREVRQAISGHQPTPRQSANVCLSSFDAGPTRTYSK